MLICNKQKECGISDPAICRHSVEHEDDDEGCFEGKECCSMIGGDECMCVNVEDLP